jgi:hypothetical protein
LPEPIAFISHSKSDSEFCHALYDELTARGIRPIMDERDFQPGDDLVRKVFDEGISASDAVLFVLSLESVDRPWLREELSVSVVQKLRRQTRLIPILIKDLPEDKVPAPLAATLWVRSPGDDVEQIASRVAGAIHADARPNPVIEAPPLWTAKAISGRIGLDSRDEVLFAFVCQKQLENPHPLISVPAITAYAAEQGLSEDDVRTALSVFQKHYYIEPPGSARGGLLPNSVRLTRPGFEIYMRTHEAERFARVMQESIAAIENAGASNMTELSGRVSEPSVALLELIVTILEAQSDLHPVSRSLNRPTSWHKQPSLKRRLE